MIQIFEYKELDKQLVFETTSCVKASLEWRNALKRVAASGRKAKMVCGDDTLATCRRPATSSDSLWFKVYKTPGMTHY
jgi:hypothetical protein